MQQKKVHSISAATFTGISRQDISVPGGEPSMITHQKFSLYRLESVVDLSLLQGTTRWAYSAAFYGVACFRDGCGLLRNGLLNLRRVGSRYSRNRVRETLLKNIQQRLYRYCKRSCDSHYHMLISQVRRVRNAIHARESRLSLQFKWYSTGFVRYLWRYGAIQHRACIPGFGLHVLS